MTTTSSRPKAAAVVGSRMPEPAWLEGARAFATDAMNVTLAPGLQLAVTHHGEVIWEEGFGMADIARHVPMTNATTCRVGSFSKTYVAMAILQLAEQGLLELYRPVREYLPDLRVTNVLGEREITIYDLLTYRSGLATDTGHQTTGSTADLNGHIARVYSTQALPEYGLASSHWTAKVGARYQYSTFGMATLGLLVERINPDGLNFADYVRESIIKPVGLTSSGFPHESDDTNWQALMDRLSTGYARFGQVCVPSPLLHPADYPASALITTPGDHARLLATFLMGGRCGNDRILRPETIELMTTPQIQMDALVPTSEWWNGIGFEMCDIGRDTFNFGHGGAQAWGWYCHAAAYPLLDLAIVVCVNQWDMTRYYNPLPELATGLITEYVVDRAISGATESEVPYPRPSWAWRASYAMGVTMVERIRGLLGVEGVPTAADIENMGANARALANRNLADFWDPDGFAAGAREMCEVNPTPASIRQFLAEDAAVTPAEFKLLGLWFGRKPGFRLPMRFFAERDFEP